MRAVRFGSLCGTAVNLSKITACVSGWPPIPARRFPTTRCCTSFSRQDGGTVPAIYDERIFYGRLAPAFYQQGVPSPGWAVSLRDAANAVSRRAFALIFRGASGSVCARWNTGVLAHCAPSPDRPRSIKLSLPRRTTTFSGTPKRTDDRPLYYLQWCGSFFRPQPAGRRSRFLSYGTCRPDCKRWRTTASRQDVKSDQKT